MKKKSEKRGKGIEFYVVSRVEYNHDSGSIDTGTLVEIYSTLKKARDSVFSCLKETAQECLDRYDKDDWNEVFGTDNADELVQRMVVVDKPYMVMAMDDDSDIMHEYVITKYSTEQIV